MLEFTTIIRKIQLKYQLKDGVLIHIIEDSRSRHETRIDLEQDSLIIKQGKGVPFECNLAISCCILIIVTLVSFIIKDIERENMAGVVGSLLGGITTFIICTYYVIQNRIKRNYFLVRAKDGNGIYVYCENNTDMEKYKAFISAVRGEIERGSDKK